MSSQAPVKERSQLGQPDKDGFTTFDWTLTDSRLTDLVKLIAGPFNVLPVVFVPGIMGSNLKAKGSGNAVWRLDSTLGAPLALARKHALADAGSRQRLLHPDRCEVDDQGSVPNVTGGSVSALGTYRERGWGTVGEGSYHAFLLWLEEQLNTHERNPASWRDYEPIDQDPKVPPKPNTKPGLAPGTRMKMTGLPAAAAEKPFVDILSDELMARAKWLFPVYAVGYNWLASNADAAKKLAAHIDNIIAENNQRSYRCEQVILVTHSMGGLVARACSQRPGMPEKIAGIVHGVMPAVGAAVAYRRCKLGMLEESFAAGLVIGSTGQEVTAVFAQSPGALQLLPSHLYTPAWLRIAHVGTAPVLQLPTSDQSGSCDPYGQIYARRDRWWGLVNEAWLAPTGGGTIQWSEYIDCLELASRFHSKLGTYYHPNSYVLYAADAKHRSFETITWRVQEGLRPRAEIGAGPSLGQMLEMRADQIRTDGVNPEYVGGRMEIVYTSPNKAGAKVYQSSNWELRGEMQDGIGDGTVPASSGAAPLKHGVEAIRQQFKLTGFAHEPAYKDDGVRRATLYAITKIAAGARKPRP